jgi:ligand-binding SRPBCC domain-containing protein
VPIHIVRYQSEIGVPRQFVWSTYMRDGQFDRLVPPWQAIRTVRQEGSVKPGDLREIELAAGPLRLRWLAVHDGYEEGSFFSDQQVRGPFRVWRHHHQFQDTADGGCLVQDEIEYQLPISPVTDALGRGIVRAELRRMFRYRHFTTFHDMHELFRIRSFERKTVVVSGEPAPVLRQLRAFLDIAGHNVLAESPSPNDLESISIALSSAGSGQVVATIADRESSSGQPVVVRSASLIVPESPLLKLARAFQFFDTTRESLGAKHLAWTTIDDFVGAVHRQLLANTRANQTYVRHADSASLRDLVESLTTGENKLRLGRPPEALVQRCLEMLNAAAKPVTDHGQWTVDSRSRYRSLPEATQTITGQT